MRTRNWLAASVLAFIGVAGMGSALATTTINKQFTPATVDPGDISTFRISIFNSSLTVLTAAAVTDNLPTQMAISNPPNITDTCGFSTVVAAVGTQAIKLSGGTVPAGSGTIDGTCYFELDVVSTTPGNWPNTILANGPANGFVPGGANPGYQATENGVVVTNSTAATATLAIRSLSNPSGSKSFAPAAGLIGEPSTLSVVLTNPNAGSTIPLTTFVDNLPAGMVVAATPTPTIVCTGTGAVNGAVTATAGATSITLTGGTIGNAGTCTLNAKVVVNSITGTSQTFTNTLPLNAIGNIRGLGSATFNRPQTVSTPIAVAKSFVTAAGAAIANPIPVNAEFWARMDITNASAVTPINLTTLTDTLPSGMVVGTSTPTMDCVSAGGGTNGTISATPGAGSFTVTGGTVGITGATKRCRISVPVIVAAAGTYINNLVLNAVGNSNGFPSPAATATANANAQLTVAKTVSSGNAAPGQPVTFTITINNYSGGAVTGVTLTDNFPVVGGGQMVISNPNGFSTSGGCSGGTWVNTPNSPSFSWSGGTITGGVALAPGVCTVTIKANAPVTATTGQVFTNTIAAGGVNGTGGAGGVSNGSPTSVSVTMVAAASVTKSFSPGSVVQGGTSVLTVTLANQTAVALTNATLTDAFSAGMVVSGTPATSTTCVGGNVSATPGGNSASISGATIPANGSCRFRVSVVGNTTPSIVNTIPGSSLVTTEGVSNPAAATATLTVNSGLTATKTFNPTSVANGGASRVTVRATNPSGTNLTNLSITDGPMTNMVVATPASASTTCAGSPVITATPGSNTVTMTGATLAAGANCDLLFNVLTSGNPASWVNTLPINAITTAEGDKNTSAVTATLNKLTTVNIGINKSFNPVSVSAGEPSQLQIDLSNPITSPATVTNLSFSDSFPAGMQVYPNPAVSTTCTNGVVTAVPGTATVSMVGATLAPGATCSVFLKITSIKFLNLTNTIPIGNVTTTEGLTNSVATTATLSTLQGVGVAKAFTPINVAPGQPTTLQLALISTLDPGASVPITLHNITFTDSLPSGVVVAPTPNASTACTNGIITAVPGATTVNLSGADLPPDTICTAFVDVVAASLGTYTNIIPKYTVTTNESYVNQSDAQGVFNVLNAPTITKAFAPNTVAPGTTSTLTITVANTNAVPLTNALLLDTLPSLLTVAPVPNTSTTCGSGAVAAAPAGSTVQLSNATIPASSSCTVKVDVRSNTPNSYVNTIPATALSTAEGVTNTSPGAATLNVIGPPGVTKSFLPTSAQTGQTSTLTISLGNPNPTATTLNSALVDTLPANLKVAGAPNVGGTCTLGSVSTSSTTITYAAGASIPAGGCTINVDVTSVVAATYTNTIPAGGLVTNDGSNGTAASASVVFTPPPAADLAITKTDGATTAVSGSTIDYTVGVSNSGPLSADAAIVTDPAVAGLTKTGVSCVANGGAVCPASLTVAELEGSGLVMGLFPAGSSATFTVNATVTALPGGSITNTAAIAVPSGMLDPTPGNDTASDTDTVVGTPDLTIAKSHSGSFVLGQAGGTFTLTVSNIGNWNSSSVAVTDTLPAGLTATTISGTGWTCVLATLTCTRSDALAPSASFPAITVSVTVDGNAVSPLTNSATVTATGDTNAANDTATDSVTILSPTDLTITKTHSGSFLRGGTGSFALTVSNLGGVASSGATSVVDTLPAGLTATAISGSGWTCVLATLTCTRSDALAAAAAYPAINVAVNVASNAGGSLTNSATVSGGGDTNAGNNTATDNVSPTGNPDLALAKTHTGSFLRGSSGTFTLTVGNVGTSATTGLVTVTDTLPAGLTASTLSGTGWTCTLSPLACTRSDALAPAASYPDITLTVSVASNAATPLVNSAVVNTAGDGNAGNNTATDSVTITGTPDLALAKTASGNFVRGQTSGTFTLTVSNVGTDVTSGTVSVVDTLPTGLAATAISGTGWTCVLASLTCTRSDALAVGNAYPDITVTVATAANAITPRTNSATVTLAADTNPANNTATAQVTVYSGPDLTVVKSHSGSFLRGSSGTFTLTVSNAGDLPSAGTVSITDTLPAGLTATTISGTGWTCVLATLTCDRSDVLAAGTAYPDITLTVDVSLTAGASQTNTAVVSGGGDLNPGNNTGTDTVLPTGSPDLAIVKTHTGNFTRGDTGKTFSLTVNNVGTLQTVGPVTVVDTLPTGLTATAIGGSGWTCVLATLTCSRSDALAAGATYPSITLTVNVASNAGNPVVNSATVATVNDPNSANDTTTDIVTVNAGPDLTIAKTHSGAFNLAQSGAFSVTVTNNGDVPSAGQVTVDDPSAAGFTVTGLAGTGWTCAGTQCTRSDALAAGAAYPDITVTVSVANNAVSPLTNTTTVAGGGDVNPTNNSATDAPTIAGYPDLAVAKTHTGNFVLGQIGATFTLTVNNLGNAQTPGTVTVTDTLPAGLTATAIAGTGWTCTLSPLACSRSDALAAAAAYPAITLTVDVASNASSPLVNTAHVSVPGDSNAANNTATDSVTVNHGPDLALVKNHSGTFLRGQSGSFTLAITNLGDVATSGTVSVTDSLPAGLTATAISGAGWTCTVTPLACSRADALAPAASYPVITVTVLVAGNAGSPLVNSATVSVTGDNNPANDTGTDSVSTLSGPDLTIAKTHNGSFIRGQVGATFTLTMSNIGDLPSSGSVTVADTLPAGLTATAINGTGWACTVTPPTCSRSDGLAPGSSYPVITLTVNVAANAAASLTNTATVTGGSDNNLSNNSASDTVSTASGPDLTIAKSHSGNFTPGQTGAVYTVTVSNNGDQPSVGAVNVTDTLPVGLTATALAGTGWACTVTPLSCTRSDVLAAGAAFPVIVLTVNVANNAAGTLTNNASVVGGGDTNPGNNTATDPTTVATGPDLKITKTHTGSFTRGQTGALFNVVVANQGGSPTVGQVSVVDTLPAGLTATAIAGTGWTCTLATLTCARLDVLAPATSYPAITVTVNVASDAPLTLTNVVDVTGGGAPPTSANTASDFVTVGGNVDLSIAMSHTGILMLGQLSQYTLAVRNVGDVPTSGMVTVTDQLPIGLSAVAIAGTGWSCVLATLTCARSDVLVPGAGYPGIVLSVNVNMDAPPNITNVATVSGGGDSNTGNNSASEVATVVGGVTKVPTLSEWDLILLVLVMMVAGGLSVRRRG